MGLLRITNAAITPGTHPARVRMKVIRTEPQPLSSTAKGGKRMANKTRQKLMGLFFRFANMTLKNTISYKLYFKFHDKGLVNLYGKTIFKLDLKKQQYILLFPTFVPCLLE